MKKEEVIQELQKDSLQSLSDKGLLFLIESYVTRRNDYENQMDSYYRGHK